MDTPEDLEQLRSLHPDADLGELVDPDHELTRLTQLAETLTLARRPPRSFEDIAAAIGMSASSVRRIHNTALAKLKRGLTEQGVTFTNL